MNILNFPIHTLSAHNEKRQLNELKNIVRHLSTSETPLTIPEIATGVTISVPTATKHIRDLLEKRCVLEEGKKETENGRKPELYALNKEKFYAVGVEILLKWIQVSIVRIDSTVLYEIYNESFSLDNSPDCLDYIVSFVQSAIEKTALQPDQLIGVGIGIAGTVNGHTGKSTHYFNSPELSLSKQLENALNLPVMIDSDTRVIGIAEQVVGEAQGAENVLIVKVSRNLGLSIILDGNLIFGGKGFAGEFGHLQIGKKERLCVCGKKGCLETEVSGSALLKDLEEALTKGETSIHFQLAKLPDYRYHDIFKAALAGDLLSMKLIMNQGDILGQALGNIVNLLNPDLIVIGGEYARVNEFFIDSIKTGIKKTGLLPSLVDCRVESSRLGGNLGAKAGAYMVFKRYEMTR
ncbi:ROK family transcriptional regulator [Spirosoma areae]